MTKEEQIENFIASFREYFERNLWRGEDETVSLMAVGNVEDWLREKLDKLI